MASRLDRLFILLESGSTASTRRAAASQLGAVQKLHPHELPQLLQRVHKCLRSPLWETRIAGGQAVEAILSQVPVWEPSVQPVDLKPDLCAPPMLNFTDFSVEKILNSQSTQLLMGSEGSLFDREAEDPQTQRMLINQKLGLDIAAKIGIDTSEMFSNEDLDTGDPLSSREVNLAKRRARKQKSRDDSSESSKKIKVDDSVEFGFGEGSDYFEKCLEEGRWPLERWVDILIADLYSPSWEIRHGSATALREVVRLHGKTACRQPTGTSLLEAQQDYLTHIALNLIQVLMLDRFGDFISDQVVAPVRETVAQCLGTTISLMSDTCVISILRILTQLLDQRAWEVRHGGLLALKYLFAIRGDLIESLLPYSFPVIFICLQDTVDDVSAVAASALIPVVQDLVKILPGETPRVVSVLWDSLNNLDDLSSACNSIMGLLAGLLAFPAARSELKSLDTLLPRLWPFLHHTSSSVRKSALLTLQKLTDLDKTVEPLSVQNLQLTLRHAFQRALTEHNQEVLTLIPAVWTDLLKSSELNTLLLAACPLIGIWLFLAMQHPRLGVDPQYLVSTGAAVKKSESPLEDKVYISGIADGNPERVAKTRFILAQMLGRLTPYIVQPVANGPPSDPLDHFSRLIIHHLNTRSALQRTVASLVISSWIPKPLDLSHSALQTKILECLNESVYYEEIAYNLTKLQADCRDFISTLKHYNVNVPEYGPYLSFDDIEKLTDDNADDRITGGVRKSKLLETLMERKKSIFNLCRLTKAEFNELTLTTQSSLSAALVSLQILPPKLNPVVKPLMDSIRREENELFQRSAADHLCHLMNLVLDRDPCPVPKIVQNITAFLCQNSTLTSDFEEGIVTLTRLSAEDKKGATAGVDLGLSTQRRGASYALSAIVNYFGLDLPVKIVRLWELTFGVLSCAGVEESGPEDLRKVIDALEILETISAKFHPDLFAEVIKHLPRTTNLLSHRSAAVRHMTSRTLSVWAHLIPERVMPILVSEILPRLESESEIVRMGGIEAIWSIVDRLGLDLLPYIVLLVVPVLGRMSDGNLQIRTLASLTFATLVRLMPLEGGVPDPPSLPAHLLQQKEEQRLFLDQLLTPTKIPLFHIATPIRATLRPYQQAGVNWLGFLNKYRLHGILCDDMGLGKTLQTICIMANGQNPKNFPSIVICPPTLTGHWVYEIEQFISTEYLNPLHYHGPPVERNKLKPRLSQHNLVVASYDIVRNDIEFFSSVHWNYCVLDEGHIIKNGKTKISLAIKQLKANHRLILSGTPIQNNVLELWSLFDFLMPGFLGTEKQFSARFGRPILLARDSKSSSKEQEAGALAMESLHRQALPFLLRRLKEDVLQDLPPKITQDYYCELSPIQEQLYEDFARTRAHQSLRDTFDSASDDSLKHSHIFQALQYLRKVCNHPKLVLTPQHPKYTAIMEQVEASKTTLDNISHSAKLPALKQLLLDCGIGVNESNNNPESIQVVNQHRALIFCQLKSMLDILENDLLKAHMRTVTYLRLDGSVPAGQRHALVTRFNNDPSIDILLLTTQVGGLGLNLTGADTVIFVEHDWNPMRDLQAMDRAHRIGQKKVVNVYRLITRGTLEEKIMGLQKFKLMTANTVITQDNASIETMATDQLLDLFVLDEDKQSSSSSRTKEADSLGIVGAYKNVLENIPDLWEDKLYDDEYDLSSFIKNLGK